MKNVGKLIVGLVCLAVCVGAVILLVKIISGALSLLGGLMDTIIAVIVIIALVAIVIWMFRYASKNR